MPNKNPLVSVTYQESGETISWIDRFAEKIGVSRSAAINLFIDYVMENEKEKLLLAKWQEARLRKAFGI